MIITTSRKVFGRKGVPPSIHKNRSEINRVGSGQIDSFGFLSIVQVNTCREE
ncbi:hypothetical protein GCM10011391_15720 [Pullulanibacillus camelliae]|uniref:Uncharacterized protein n=1 Tax=Pullulanibacillus camelliae TaxID=1707096 RepID=A0A8J2VM63_9BACL|nr:hypothetical protein GCM10011391_15720 [Pullulanibacillus camelliae]